MSKTLSVALAIVEANHQWHIDHDDHDGYPESELAEQNLAAIGALKAEMAALSKPVGQVRRTGKRADGKPWVEADFPQDGTADFTHGTLLYVDPAAAPTAPPRFPTMLRKMWSGAEVQAWIDEHWQHPAPAPAPQPSPDSLHAQIMNLPAHDRGLESDPDRCYAMGHRDARHAAAELVLSAIAADRAAPAAPAADEREARQTRAPRVLAKARRVSEHSNAWNVMIGNTCVRQWMQGTYGDGPYRTAQESAEAFAAAINAELDGGVAAFGCIGESDYKKLPCMTWCGSARCVHTVANPHSAAPQPPKREPLTEEAAAVPEGCTPADAQVLRQANHQLAQELHDARTKLDDEFETRSDGKRVRKDRWQWGIRRIVALLWGNQPGFEVDEVVEAVRALVPAPKDDDEALVAAMGKLGAQPVALEDQQAFEAAMAAHGYQISPLQYRDGTYRDSCYEAGWAMWRARAAHPGAGEGRITP